MKNVCQIIIAHSVSLRRSASLAFHVNVIRWAPRGIAHLLVVLVRAKRDLPDPNVRIVRQDFRGRIVKNVHVIQEEQCQVANASLIVNAK